MSELSANVNTKIVINGYGTIGKRVADAVALQSDMELAGVAKTRPNFEAAGMEVSGTVEDMLEVGDVVVDCTPNKVGARNKPLYDAADIKDMSKMRRYEGVLVIYKSNLILTP